MRDFTIEVVTDGNIEQCRELCDELMAFQKSQAVIAQEAFDLMNFDTRFKTSFESTPLSHVAVVKDGGTPVGYVFSTIEDIHSGDKSTLPDWAPDELRERIDKAGGKFLGFYPEWDNLPEKCGCLNHLYLRDVCRGSGVGRKLCDMAIDWMREYTDLAFVYISNGNEDALNFYLKYGFTYSHDVFGGFIKAAYMRI